MGLRLDQLGKATIDTVFATDAELSLLTGVQRQTIIDRLENLSDAELIQLGIPKTIINGQTGVIGKNDLVAVLLYASQLEGGLMSADDKTKLDGLIGVPPSSGIIDVGKTLVATDIDNTSEWETTSKSVVFGDGITDTILITHGLNTRNLDILVRQNNFPYRKIECEVYFTTTDTITLQFGNPPSINEFLITIIKK